MVSRSSKPKVLTKEEEEAKSQAYINKLLAQEQEAEDIYSLNYYEGYGNSLNDDYNDFDDDDYDDDDYDYGSNKKKNSSSSRRKYNGNDDDDYEFNGRSSNKKRIPVKKPTVSKKKRRQEDEGTDNITEDKKNEVQHRKINNPLGTYSPEEETKFIEGIEIYGRDWKNLSKYIGTRNSKSIRSHAQKYFIKLYREAKPLPNKVRESGSGYTLSGKPLDPNSASAKPYLANVDIAEIERKIALFNGNQGYENENGNSKPDVTKNNISKTDNKEENENNIKDKSQFNQSNNNINNNNNDNSNSNKNNNNDNNIIVGEKKNISKESVPQKKENNKKQNVNKKLNSKAKILLDSIEYDEDGRTLYSKQRPKRSTASRNLNYKDFIDTSNPLTMVKCESYYGVPGSGTPGSQPFSIIVNPVALATMDLHSHLVKTEIIGLLAGEWNMEEKKLYVISAYPCKSIENDEGNLESVNRHVNVEMDPVGEFEIRNEINKLNMKVVGWYHSHPKFAPDPSFVDIENQLNYQTLFREKNNIDEPFVGVIVGPYDPRLPRSYSAVNWFYVENKQEEFGHPKHLVTKTEWINKDKNNIPVKEYEKMKTLINNYKDHMERHDFTETWKQNLEETKLEKVIKSLSYQLQLLNTNNNNNDDNSATGINNQNSEVITEDNNIQMKLTSNTNVNKNKKSATGQSENTINENNDVDYNFDDSSELSDISTLSSVSSSLGLLSDSIDGNNNSYSEKQKIKEKEKEKKKEKSTNENTIIIKLNPNIKKAIINEQNSSKNNNNNNDNDKESSKEEEKLDKMDIEENNSKEETQNKINNESKNENENNNNKNMDIEVENKKIRSYGN